MFIGPKKIKTTEMTDEKTISGNDIIMVVYEDGSEEHFSKMMYDRIVTKKSCDLSELRDKRVFPVVEVALALFRDWGLKTGELQYFSALLNKSLDFNSSQAYTLLVSKYMPKPNSMDDVDFITIDRILRNESKDDK